MPRNNSLLDKIFPDEIRRRQPKAATARRRTTHTPGPWLWKPYPHFGAEDGAEILSAEEVQHTSKLKGPEYIGVTYTQANARIMAAAPAMLEALERFFEVGMCPETVGALQAALKLARGG